MAHLASIGWKPYTVWKWFKSQPANERLSEQYIYQFCRGEPIKKEEVLEKLAKVEGLGLSLPQLRAWWLLDKASTQEMALILTELMGQPELVGLIDKVIAEKKG